MKIYKISQTSPRSPRRYSSPMVDDAIRIVRFSDDDFLMALKALQHMGEAGVDTSEAYNNYYAHYGHAFGMSPEQYSKALGYIALLNQKALSDARVRKFLGNLSRVTNLVASYANPSLANIDDDLSSIVSNVAFTHKGSRKDHYPMYAGLYNEFKNAIANAANAVGEVNVENAIRSDALLNPSNFKNTTILMTPSQSAYEVASGLVDYCMRNNDINLLGRNFNMVKDTIMSNFAPGDAEKRRQIEERRKRETMEGKGVEDVKPVSEGGKPFEDPATKHSYDPSNEEWMVPAFVTTLVVFFNIYEMSLKRLPS